MLRQSIIYLLLSILVVIFARYFHLLIVYIDMLYTLIYVHMTPLFQRGGIGDLVGKVAVLVLIPIILACIPALVYYVVRRRNMPGFFELTWCLWLVIVLSEILIH